ncbi:MAG TPA: 30S ribosomal protein S20 [Candidatus Polarisedimenticolaceae bacterium]|nr:30S ribosomal protein S20 [Candidatus Polarisedimenticolaceae bacterium]
MATHENALKAQRQAARRREVNRMRRARLRTAIKRLRATLDSGDAAAARELLGSTLGIVDRSCKTGVIHPRNADRTKARLTRAYNRVAARA